MEKKTLVVIGGGAAGFFGAIVAAGLDPSAQVILLEKTRQPLAKVRISGGGRCNVTHDCYDPKHLSTYYPRGHAVLRHLFYRFHPQHMIEWLKERGVEVKVEADGRIFPVTDSSKTIIDCFLLEAKKLGIDIQLEQEVTRIEKSNGRFVIHIKDKIPLVCDKVLLATGGLARSYHLAEELGHKIIPPVPSLFTLNIEDARIEGLSGISVAETKVSLVGSDLEAQGPLLITHWGMSGPAILKLSSFGARFLSELDYKAKLKVNWVPKLNEESLRKHLMEEKKNSSSKPVVSTPLFSLPKNLWKRLVLSSQMPEERLWAHFSKEEMRHLVDTLHRSLFRIEGKSTYKEEFVTCGGIPWEEISSKTMESKVCSGLYFAGELIDADGVTGGFNFQNAWTTAWVAAHAMMST